VGNKSRGLNGDITFVFEKLTESLEKSETLNLELQREAIETTKSIAQSMIAIKGLGKKIDNKLYNWHKFLQLNLELDVS
jgi:hypothetical protein